MDKTTVEKNLDWFHDMLWTAVQNHIQRHHDKPSHIFVNADFERTYYALSKYTGPIWTRRPLLFHSIPILQSFDIQGGEIITGIKSDQTEGDAINRIWILTNDIHDNVPDRIMVHPSLERAMITSSAITVPMPLSIHQYPIRVFGIPLLRSTHLKENEIVAAYKAL